MGYFVPPGLPPEWAAGETRYQGGQELQRVRRACRILGGEVAKGMAEERRSTLYDEVTAKIVGELEAGRFPWVQPWGSAGTAAPGLTGMGIDKWLRPKTFTDIGLFLVAVLILAVTTGAPLAIYGPHLSGIGFWRVGDALSDRIGACCRSCGRRGSSDDRHGMEHRHFWRSRHRRCHS